MNYIKAANTVLGVCTKRVVETNSYQGITIVSGTALSGKSSMMAAINNKYYGRFDTEVLLILTEELWGDSPLRGDKAINATGWGHDQFKALFSGGEIHNQFTHVVIDTLPPNLSMEDSREILVAMKNLHKEFGINFLVSCHKRKESSE